MCTLFGHTIEIELPPMMIMQSIVAVAMAPILVMLARYLYRRSSELVKSSGINNANNPFLGWVLVCVAVGMFTGGIALWHDNIRSGPPVPELKNDTPPQTRELQLANYEQQMAEYQGRIRTPFPIPIMMVFVSVAIFAGGGTIIDARNKRN